MDSAFYEGGEYSKTVLIIKRRPLNILHHVSSFNLGHLWVTAPLTHYPSVVFYIKTSQLISTVNKLTGFYVDCNH